MTSHTHDPTAARSPDATTLYLGAPEVARLVTSVGLSACIADVAERIHAAFLRWPDFDKTPRVASHSSVGTIELMPVADTQHYGFKYVNGHPQNAALGLPTVMAFGVLADVTTGHPNFLAELTLTTAIRTAAMSALAAKHLARPDSRVMAIIGNGAQSEFQALAFRDSVGVHTLRLFDVDPTATTKLMRNLAGTGLRCEPCASVADAVRGADIITTITADKKRAAIITADMLSPGQHFNAVGGDCPGKTELHPEVLRHATRVFVEFEPQTRIEGDVQAMPADFPVTALWQVFSGAAPGRLQADDVTVFDSVGFALEDLAALQFLQAQALRLGLGEALQLVPTMPDPKDLFGTLNAARRDVVKGGVPNEKAEPLPGVPKEKAGQLPGFGPLPAVLALLVAGR
jgi:ornithine cyclodeaminase